MLKKCNVTLNIYLIYNQAITWTEV